MNGKIKAISKFQGLMFENQTGWFNPKIQQLKDYIKTLKVGDIVNYSADSEKKLSTVIKIVPGTSPRQYIPQSQSITPTKEAKDNGLYTCSICSKNYIEAKTKLLCEQNHYLKDIADTLRGRM